MIERVTTDKLKCPMFFNDHKEYDTWHQREEISFRTRELEDVLDADILGWTNKQTKEGYIVRAPEQWLVDLTDPYKVISCGDVVCNLAYYQYLNALIHKQDFLDFIGSVAQKNGLHDLIIHQLRGPSLETEIRVAGSDKRISELRKLAYWEAKQDPTWPYYQQQAQEQLSSLRHPTFGKKTIFDNEAQIAQYFSFIKDRLSIVDPKRASSVFNPEYIPELFDDLPQFDVYVFILWGSLRYLSSFLEIDKLPKTMFWEVHYDAFQEHTYRFLAQDIRDKQVLIIDTSYSGGTLGILRNKICDEGGVPTRLALFPKSKLAIYSSELSLVLDTTIKSNAINTQDSDWAISLYQKALANV